MKMSDAYWRQPLRWNEEAAVSGERWRVFCSSMADWADSEGLPDERLRLFDLMRRTPALDWLLLSKRASNIAKFLPSDWGSGYPNCWLGVSVENKQHGLPRINILRTIPASIRFLSIEPLLEDLGAIDLSGIAWAIIGGESGHGARTMDTKWVENIVNQCKQQQVAAWVKQLGRNPTDGGSSLVIIGGNGRPSGHADKMEDWPEHLSQLRTRELPERDPDQIASDLNASALNRIGVELDRLAADLEPIQTEAERRLRNRYLKVEGKLFSDRQEKGRVLREYHALYAPLGKWSEFLRIAEVDRRTAYRWIELADEQLCQNDTTAASPSERPAITAAQVVVKATKAVQRLVSRLQDQDQVEAARQVIEALTIEYGLKIGEIEAVRRAA
jgi:protein gp37